ncbi:hypothetical protein EDC56_3537 [Sinobacterium caligoides]|uniref:Uncharacterized protein n=2 Tax=Sinobacterium caligoides TaxID=933926 RepID=A0A3N2DDJ5_9GAMM|nr:hypothetical protein EDC56_3537 [Sinobacterium caligoides]
MDLLHEKNALYEWEAELQKEIYQWFKDNLKVPKVQSSESGKLAKVRAISWFKSTAIEHIDRMRQYGQILEAHDFKILQLITERPGKVLYEDDHQIAAIPFGDTFA